MLNAGDVEPCTNRLSGETGQRICQDKGLYSLVFGDCKSKVTAEKIAEKADEPSAEKADEPSAEKAPEPSQEPGVEPAAEPNPEPKTEASLEPSDEKRTEQAKEPIHEEPVRADAGEPTTETIPEGCSVGATEPCYSGSPGTMGVGNCKSGTRTCKNGAWGPCIGEITPAEELCGNKKDDDCDGIIDNATGGCLFTIAGSGQNQLKDGIALSAGLFSPYGLTSDGSSIVYFTDDDTIREFNPITYKVKTIAGSTQAGFANGTGSTAQFNYPTGITLSSAGRGELGVEGGAAAQRGRLVEALHHPPLVLARLHHPERHFGDP